MDSIRELIVKNRFAALERITRANGYDNTVASVQRKMQEGQAFSDIPMLILNEDDDEKSSESTWPIIQKRLMLFITIITRIDTLVDSRSADEVINSLRCDVERAWMADSTCGGYALDTNYESSGPLDVLEGQPEIGAFIAFSVNYRHNRTDPRATI